MGPKTAGHVNGVYDNFVSPEEFAENLKAQGLLPEHVKSAWITEHHTVYDPSDKSIVVEGQMTFVKKESKP